MDSLPDTFAPTNLETVWLKDVTTKFQTDKRTLSDLDLPNELTFHLRRGSDALTLNLKRNHDINPNADDYFVRRLKDGRSVPVKTRNLEKEDVAYYQNREIGAFMTARCVKRSNEQCDRVINGNIRIGDSSYDLRPEETDVTSRYLLEVPGLLGKRYVLQDQEYIQRENSVENKDAAHVNDKNVKQDLVALLRRFEGQDKQNHFPHSDATFSSRNVAGLHTRGATAKGRLLCQGRRTDRFNNMGLIFIDGKILKPFEKNIFSEDKDKRSLLTHYERSFYEFKESGMLLAQNRCFEIMK